MKKTVKQLADIVGGEPLGNESTLVSKLVSIENAELDSIAPFFSKNALEKSQSIPGAVLTTSQLVQFAFEAGARSAIVHESPPMALRELIDVFFPSSKTTAAVHSSAVIDINSDVHPSVSVGPLVVIESGVKIGEGSVICPRAIICTNSQIGKHVTIGPGSVIGGDGFGYAPSPNGPLKIRHVGNVVIEDHVEIGANTCIDRATLGSTVVGESSKLDNLVQVGHNVKIGKCVLIVAQVGIAGSTSVGDGAMLGGQVGIGDHLEIGAGAKIAGKSGVTRNVEAGSIVGGYPAVKREKWLRSTAWLMQASSCTDGSDREDR